MRPIETEYRGVTFRSRLEARWAVFFDRISWVWLYEQKSVPFNNGTYTPDFWIDSHNLFAEVKPCWPTKFELDKMKESSKYSKGTLLLIGPPNFQDYWMITLDGEEMVMLGFDGVHSSPMSRIVNQHDFSPSYHAAIDYSKNHRFDGYDNDRLTIKDRYADSD